MISLILNGLCCCCITGANLTKEAFQKSIKLSYIGVSLLFCGLILLMTLFGDSIVNVFSKFVNCPDNEDLSICMGISLIVRISLSLLILHTVILILLFTRDSFAKFVNEQCMLLKILFVFVLTFFLLFIHNDYLYYYVKVSSFLSLVFLIYQSIILIDFGYVWNEVWVEKYENGTTFYGILLIIFSLLLITADVFLLKINISEFWIDGCNFNKLSIIFAIILTFVFLILVLLKLSSQSSILTALFISTLYIYLNGLALSSNPDSICNPDTPQTKMKSLIYGYFLHISINLVLGFITVSFASLADNFSKSFQEAQLDVVNQNKEQQTETESENQELMSRENHTTPDQTQIYKTNYYIWFHFMMAFFSIYILMIFFDWQDLNIDFDQWTSLTRQSKTGFWNKLINSFVLIFMYLWTLIAPAIFTGRSFD